MAGDHKCPVCSSTFTRPQHVARHMRSHTGDRPYKCVHCGDQFARSDLLSRHVNKCHASEKPPTTTQPARRKGHAHPGSSSTGVRGPAPPLIPPPGSRNICDPCAHSRTPAQCDSGLPCGKCLQRSTRCTYVKAHDTLGIPSGTASASASVSHPHDLLSNPSTSHTVPSMAAPPTDSIFPSQPDFNFTVPLYPQSLDPRSDYTASPQQHPHPHPHPPSLSLSSSTGESVDSHASHPHDIRLINCAQSEPPSAYTNHSAHVPQYNDGCKPVDMQYLGHPFPSSSIPNYIYNPPPDLSQQPAQHVGVNSHRQYSFDVYYNDPSQQPDADSDFGHVFQSGFQQQQPQHHHQHHQEEYPTFPDGAVSSAFGLMSLDDPAVAAEMSKDNSFFSPGAAATASAHKPERDANIAELRDFWKAFMRDTPNGERAPSDQQPHQQHQRPAARRSLSKMASLPDIKTPPVDAGPHYSTAEEPRYHTHAATKEDLSSYEQAVLARKLPILRPPPERPPFKRLASQTLGPFESKSAKVSHPAVEATAAYESGGSRYGGGHAQSQSQNREQQQQQQQQPHQRQQARSPSGEVPPVLQHDRERETGRRLSAPSVTTRLRSTETIP